MANYNFTEKEIGKTASLAAILSCCIAALIVSPVWNLAIPEK
ncbi:MAG: hypothetical protein ABUK01_11460 [Leptospirales bacterium]